MMGKWAIPVLFLITFSLLLSSPNIKSVEGSVKLGAVIKADGSVDGTNNILRNGDVYYFTDDIEFSSFEFVSRGLVVQRDNIVIDGNGFGLIQRYNLTSHGVDLSERFNVTVKNLNIIGFSTGIDLTTSISNNSIVGNVITSPMESGIQIGIWSHSSDNEIINNTVTGFNADGILIYNSHNNNISGNVLTENAVGLSLHYSKNNVLRNNQMYANGHNFEITFRGSDDFIHDIDTSNTVNSKPIYYWINQHNKSMPSDAGFVALGDCTEITVEDLSIEHNGNGIVLYSTTESVIRSNSLENCGNAIEIRNCQTIEVNNNQLINNSPSGIRLAECSHVNITQNSIVNSSFGITLCGLNGAHAGYGGSNNISILCNNFTGNNPSIDITYSNENVISGNNFTNNLLCIRSLHNGNNLIVGNNFADNNGPVIYLCESVNNVFYHNNFANNTDQGLQISWYYGNSGEHNIWDNGTEGNYWSDYTGTDHNGDGVGSVPYIMNKNNQDNFPLTEPLDINLMTIPEFPSWVVLPLFLAATSVAILYSKRVHGRLEHS